MPRRGNELNSDFACRSIMEVAGNRGEAAAEEVVMLGEFATGRACRVCEEAGGREGRVVRCRGCYAHYHPSCLDLPQPEEVLHPTPMGHPIHLSEGGEVAVPEVQGGAPLLPPLPGGGGGGGAVLGVRLWPPLPPGLPDQAAGVAAGEPGVPGHLHPLLYIPARNTYIYR